MTPQEFFKKDLFAENAGVVLLEVREDTVKPNWNKTRTS